MDRPRVARFGKVKSVGAVPAAERRSVRLLAMDEVLIGGIEKREIVIVDYDPRWPEQFQKHAQILSLRDIAPIDTTGTAVLG